MRTLLSFDREVNYISQKSCFLPCSAHAAD